MYSSLKNDLADIIIENISPIRNEYERIIDDKDYICKILKDGSYKASLKARKTLEKVHRKVGFIKR